MNQQSSILNKQILDKPSIFIITNIVKMSIKNKRSA